MKKLFAILISLAMLGVLSCSRNSNLAGGSTAVTENTISGVVVDSNGNGLEGVEVSLYQKSYSSISSVGDAPKTYTDSTGYFVFEEVMPDIYNLEVSDSSSQQKAIYKDIVLQEKNAVVLSDSITLADPGELNLNISEFNLEVGDVVVIPGTSVSTVVDSFVINEGVITIKDIPADSISDIIVVNPDNPDSTSLISDTIVVDPGETENPHVYRDWTYNKTLSLDVRNVKKTITHFPVLLRLNNSNFSFSEALSKGEDIRFTRSDSIVLPFEIERWNQSNRLAEIWISLDTIFGDSNYIDIQMYWGNHGTQLPQFKKWPFHSDYGFAGVWHLKESQPDTVTDELYANSVSAADYGDDRVMSSSTTGVIGRATHIVGNDYINIKHASNALKAFEFTLSAWINVDSVSNTGGEILSMGDNYGLRVEAGGAIRLFLVEVTMETATRLHTNQKVDDGNWHHVAATYGNKTLAIYIDGKLDTLKVDTNNFTYNIEDNFSIGRHSHKPGFKMLDGKFDEIRVEHVVREPEWIEFLFETQKPGSSVLQ